MHLLACPPTVVHSEGAGCQVSEVLPQGGTDAAEGQLVKGDVRWAEEASFQRLGLLSGKGKGRREARPEQQVRLRGKKGAGW